MLLGRIKPCRRRVSMHYWTIMSVVAFNVAILASTGCQPSSRVTSDSDIENITHDELLELLAKDQRKHPTVLVDVRSAERYAGGHLPHAINIPLPDLKASDSRLQGKKTTVVVYSDNWPDRLSQAAWKKLTYQGHKRVYEYRGGIQTWEGLGGEVVRE